MHFAKTLFCLAVLAAASPALAQAPDLAGNWQGSMDMTFSNGRTEHGAIVLMLSRRDGQFTGTVGPGEQQQSPITNAAADGTGLQFDMDTHGPTPLHFRLRREGGVLRGEASGPLQGMSVTATVELSPAGASLREEIAAADSALFAAFNRRDLAALQNWFAPDLEFFHDKDGVTGYQANMDAFRRHFTETARLRRELVAGSLEVYPVAEYGAIEVGIHRFYTTEPGQPEKLTATAKFLHIWRKENGQWKIVRAVSYDHE